MNTVFMGSPDFALPALTRLIEYKYNIVAVYTQPDKAAGRGRQMVECAVKKMSMKNGLRVVQPATFKERGAIEQLADLKPDIIIVAAYGQILPDAVLNMPRFRCLNIHPSLLPKYRGPSPIAAAILNGETNTGVTIMLIEKKVDSGPIISQQVLAISDEDTSQSLGIRLAMLGSEMLVTTIPRWVSGKIVAREQEHSLASYTRMESKEDGALDWKLTADQLWRQVRAYQPWPGCYISWKGGRIKINKVVPILDEGLGKHGEVIILPRNAPARVAVRTGQGLLGLITVQPEGKREMSAQEFAAGHRDFNGSIL